MDSNSPTPDWNDRSLADLMEHIVQTHHTYCRREVLDIASLFKEAISEQGNRHPELKRIHDLFFQMTRDLSMHLLKEEQTLFPYIARVEEAISKGIPLLWPPFGTVENPIRMMILEHVKTDVEIEQMRRLSNGYTAPDDASQAYLLLYGRLAAFNRDMQRHIDCENNVLFPRAIAMEESACNPQRAANG